jgi:undecaprenyl-diphosphatase
VLWWNGRHHWASATQLGNRGHLQDRFQFDPSTFLNFLGSQAVVISPLLFVALLAVAVWIGVSLLRKKSVPVHEGDLLLLLLFLSVFLFYAILALHLRCEPNWPAVSYLSLLVILAGHGREILAVRWRALFLAIAFCVAWAETVLLHDTRLLPLPPRVDPMDRTAGWSEIANRLHDLQRRYAADEFVADGYKEASVLSFHLPGKPFVYALRHDPPANQFDFWPGLPAGAPHRVLWVTDDRPPSALAGQFTTIVPLDRIVVWYRGGFLRAYRVYLCENGPPR